MKHEIMWEDGGMVGVSCFNCDPMAVSAEDEAFVTNCFLTTYPQNTAPQSTETS